MQQLIDTDIQGVYILPKILTNATLQEILHVSGTVDHHDEGGHDSALASSERPRFSFRASKPFRLPSVARAISEQLGGLEVVRGRSWQVDAQAQLYRLSGEGSVVPPHVDEDFEVSGGGIARYSILL